MKMLRSIIRGVMLATVAIGMSLAPANAAETADATSAAAVCEPGIYELYNSSGEFVGVLWVRKDCSSQVIWAE
jgi:hypothetical protein